MFARESPDERQAQLQTLRTLEEQGVGAFETSAGARQGRRAAVMGMPPSGWVELLLEAGDAELGELRGLLHAHEQGGREVADADVIEAQDGSVSLGQLKFANRDQYDSFVRQQESLFGWLDPLQRKTQLDTLKRLEQQGIGAFEQPLPHTNATIDQLLRHTVEPDGSFVYGGLHVAAADAPAFEAAERTLAGLTPEAVDTLAALEAKEITLRLNHAGDNSYSPARNELCFDPNTVTMGSDAHSKLPAAVVLLHEESHAIEDYATGQTLINVPASGYDNIEERRVIEGPEARASALLGKAARPDHHGWVSHTDSPVGTAVVLPVSLNGTTENVGFGGSLAGMVIGVTDNSVRLQGANGEIFDVDLMSLSNALLGSGSRSHLLGFFADPSVNWSDTAWSVLQDMRLHGDWISLRVTQNGIALDDPALLQRYRDRLAAEGR